jgi:deoxyribodipyrimidine photo-lyase
VRRDLRLTDNLALATAAANGRAVVPVFVLDPDVLASPYHLTADKRKAFLFHGLRALDAELRQRGSRLIVRHGRALEALTRLVAETRAEVIVAGEDFTPFGARRDARVAVHLPLTLVNNLTVHHPARLLKADGHPYTVFTPFSRAWHELDNPGPSAAPAPQALLTPALASDNLPDGPPPGYFWPGEHHAQATLDGFTAGEEAPIYAYAAGRDRLDWDGTSALSPYMRFGMLSAKQAVAAAQAAIARAPHAAGRAGAELWLNELVWREFFIAILYHFPSVRQQAFRPALREVAWTGDETAFTAWREGRTGYPVVDAAMRQLAATGWMHNRARMIVASFLVKDLLVDWRQGEAWFMQHLVDGDPAANNGGWQWVAGVGTDAAPFFRVFNPTLQAARYDPFGAFVRAWVPELRRVPDERVHEPWRMSPSEQRDAQCRIGQDYPAPIIDHVFARNRALVTYRQAKPARVAPSGPLVR